VQCICYLNLYCNNMGTWFELCLCWKLSLVLFSDSIQTQLEAELAGGDPLRPVYLLGESFGALVAIALAQRCQAIDRVVLCNPVSGLTYVNNGIPVWHVTKICMIACCVAFIIVTMTWNRQPSMTCPLSFTHAMAVFEAGVYIIHITITSTSFSGWMM
jgi:hypothetical protein